MRCSSFRAVSFQQSACSLFYPMFDGQRAREDTHAFLRPKAESRVERFGLFVFDLYFNVRNFVCCATFICCFKEGFSHALASGFRADVKVFYAGEEATGRDVEAVGEDCHSECTVFGPSGQYLYVSGFDGFAQSYGEGFGDGLAVSE